MEMLHFVGEYVVYKSNGNTFYSHKSYTIKLDTYYEQIKIAKQEK